MSSEDPQKLTGKLQAKQTELAAFRDPDLDFYDYALVGYLTMDDELVIRESNLTAATMLGLPCPQLIGAKLSELVSPGYRDTCIRHFHQILKSRERQTCQLRFQRTNGTDPVLRVESVPSVGKADGVPVFQTILIDVTDLVETKEQLQHALEQLEMAARAAELGVWGYDLVSRMSQWNGQLYRLLGLEPQDGPEDGERFFEFIHPEDRAGRIVNLRTVLEEQGDHLNEEFRVIRADGEVRWLAARGRIYRDERGQAVRICGINFDITERKLNEETVHLAQIRLATQLSETERINEELSQYAYAVSHDLKGPLRAIRNYAEFLYEDLADILTGNQKKYIEGMKTAVEQGDLLINDLLSYSRIERVPLEAEPADIVDVVAEIRYLLDSTTDVEIAVQAKWPDFNVDRTLLKRILQNLISNGIKFNESTPKRIEIGWQPAPNDRIEIFVRDNGIGIEPQYWDQIFRIFQRLHTDRAYEGTGIGLAIVQKAAQMLRGSVRLESEPGKGSTFYVQLPREMVA